jgi:hypothetical protein
MAEKRGAPKGNQNATADKRLWRATIKRAITQGDPEKLRKIADTLIRLALDGDIQAIKEIGDRIDGKPSQSIEQTTEITGHMEHEISTRPQLTKAEWMEAHGLGAAAGTTV